MDEIDLIIYTIPVVANIPSMRSRLASEQTRYAYISPFAT